MSKHDPVGDFLRSKGYPEHVVDGGLERLLSGWESTAHAVATGQTSEMDGYLNDLDQRQIIDEIQRHVPQAIHGAIWTRLEMADARFLSSVERSEHSLWGDRNAEDNGWTADNNWWYFHRAPSSVEE
jgi:hypothetical protein